MIQEVEYTPAVSSKATAEIPPTAVLASAFEFGERYLSVHRAIKYDFTVTLKGGSSIFGEPETYEGDGLLRMTVARHEEGHSHFIAQDSIAAITVHITFALAKVEFPTATTRAQNGNTTTP